MESVRSVFCVEHDLCSSSSRSESNTLTEQMIFHARSEYLWNKSASTNIDDDTFSRLQRYGWNDTHTQTEAHVLKSVNFADEKKEK